MLLHLIRHGQTDWNAVRRVQGQTDSQLDPTGYEQARALGQRLSATPFVRAHVSSSVRTRQTAATLFEGRDIPQRFSDELREMRLGRWETHLWQDIEASEVSTVALYSRFDDAFFVEGAERISEMQQRGVDAIEAVIQYEQEAGTDAAANIAVVSHGFLLRAILAHYLKLPLTAFAGHAGLPNCAHSILEVTPDQRIVKSVDGAPPETGLWAAIVTSDRH